MGTFCVNCFSLRVLLYLLRRGSFTGDSSADMKTSYSPSHNMEAVYVYLMAGVSCKGAKALQLASSHWENR